VRPAPLEALGGGLLLAGVVVAQQRRPSPTPDAPVITDSSSTGTTTGLRDHGAGSRATDQPSGLPEATPTL
jgi:hypothetical protein